jgi:hypothetical protein
MFTPNTDCLIFKTSRDSFDAYGTKISGKPVKSRCGVVKLKDGTHKTTVRADSGGSRGKANEYISDSVLMFLPTVDIEIGDKVKVLSIMLEVAEIHQRISVYGRLSHYEVELDRGSS